VHTGEDIIPGREAMDKIRTLILTGQNMHEWKRSAPFCWLLLQNTGRFDVTLTTNPSETLEDAGKIKEFSLLFSDYAGPDWSPAAKENMEAFVAGGGGLALFHAACIPFKGWKAFETMVPFLWREEGGHGTFHEFLVTITDRDHPITRGLGDARTTDELYHRMAHLYDNPYRVLATAFASLAEKGTGRDEPMIIVSEFGKGRVFQQMLGHVWERDPEKPDDVALSMISLENPFFQRTLIRGCDWAATGTVTVE
jgi:type 1 glutamine amidotransferase